MIASSKQPLVYVVVATSSLLLAAYQPTDMFQDGATRHIKAPAAARDARAAGTRGDECLTLGRFVGLTSLPR